MEVNLDFLEYQQRLNEFLTDTESDETKNQHDLLMLRHVFKFIHKNFNKINDTIQMADVLPILHHSLRLQLQTKNSMHVGAYVYALLNLSDNNSNSDGDLQRCLQILYQIQQTLSPEDTQLLQIGNEIFVKLIEILLSNRSTSNNANILACLQLYVKKFGATEVVSHLWNSVKDHLNSNEIIDNIALLQTLIHFFDDFSSHINDFKQSTGFTQLILRLLDSDQHDNRKCAYFLLKKAHLVMEEQVQLRMFVAEKADTERTRNFWNICINNLENLEENQSHLILPSLMQLKNLNISDLTEQIWLNILYRQILRHNNILVRRWILEYLIDSLPYFSLTSETQVQFMLALNDTSLYNIEVYMLQTENIGRFLQCNQSSFLQAFSKVDWKAIPLHFWLTQLILHWKTVSAKVVSDEVPMNLATKIRAMQNVEMRRENILLFKKLFSKIIDDMELIKYIQLVETLHNVSDPYDDGDVLCVKIEKCKQFDVDGNRLFTLRFYNMLTNQFPPNNLMFENISKALKEKIERNNWTPGSLLFLMIFDSSSDVASKFCQDHFGINRSYIRRESSLNDVYEQFYEKLRSNDLERSLIKQKVTDWFIRTCISSYAELQTYKVSPEELLNAGSIQTLLRLTALLVDHPKFIGLDMLKCFAEKLRDHLKREKLCLLICDNIMLHCKRTNLTDPLSNSAKVLLELDDRNAVFESVTSHLGSECFSNDFLIHGALLADTKTGDSRIEEAYECKILQRESKLFLVRNKYTKLIASISDEKRKDDILNTLCEMIQSIHFKRPRYYANSKEHRSILHIMNVIYALLPKTNVKPETTSKLWTFLFEHNNQQNVAILYQIAIVITTSWQDILNKATDLLKASTCTPSQMLSIIVIIYRKFKRKFVFSNSDEQQIHILCPLTMGAHFQTRHYAQIAIFMLLNDSHDCKLKFSNLFNILKEVISEKQLKEFEKDLRFMDISINDAFGEVLDFTNSPYDEYDFKRYKRFQTKAVMTKPNNNESQLDNSVAENIDVQRKLNPVADFLPPSNLYSYPECKENVLYVVASLLDKIPNLGGIARTCEVLGIKNLVIDSKAHIAKADFKNLSMTAEKNLNILEVKPSALMEFILQKKTEGFEIIGAEQTANSCSFVNFVFPKRSVLLLGHEKEGIPPNLLGFLDHAVEIPQFGMIRSLNVHVTGALFMWKYCEQHIIPA